MRSEKIKENKKVRKSMKQSEISNQIYVYSTSRILVISIKSWMFYFSNVNVPKLLASHKSYRKNYEHLNLRHNL